MAQHLRQQVTQIPKGRGDIAKVVLSRPRVTEAPEVWRDDFEPSLG